MGKKPRPTIKLAVQLIDTAMDVAKGRADCEKSSDTKNQGIEPGPTAKNTTNMMTRAMQKMDMM